MSINTKQDNKVANTTLRLHSPVAGFGAFLTATSGLSRGTRSASTAAVRPNPEQAQAGTNVANWC